MFFIIIVLFFYFVNVSNLQNHEIQQKIMNMEKYLYLT